MNRLGCWYVVDQWFRVGDRRRGAALTGPSLRPGRAKQETLSGATGRRQPVSLREALAGGGGAS